MVDKQINLVYGYCRVSTQYQNVERQIRNIHQAAPNAIIYQEKYTGTEKEGRKEWAKLLKIVKPGDTIYFDSVSRMSRNAKEGFGDYEELFAKGITLIFLKEPHINTDVYRDALSVKIPLTDTPVDIILEAVEKYVLLVAKQFIIAAFEEAEAEIISLRQRTSEGMETARRHGKQIGRKPGQKVTTKKSVETKRKMQKYCTAFGGTMTDKEFIENFNIRPATYYKYKRELKADLEGSEDHAEQSE